MNTNKKGFAIASLIIGILSVTICCIGGSVLGILGFILGIISLCRKESSKGMAIGGMLISIIGFVVGVIVVVMIALGIIGGAAVSDPNTRYDYIEKTNRSADEHAEYVFEKLDDALEVGDAEAVKELLSPYAIEHAENLDEKIQELIEFCPGYDEYEVTMSVHETAHRGVMETVIYPLYTITKDGETYEMKITMYTENDVDSDKIGVHNIQVMTEEAKPEGFKWKKEEQTPGVYVLE